MLLRCSSISLALVCLGLCFAVAGFSETPTVLRVQKLMNDAEYAKAQELIARTLGKQREIDENTKSQLYWLEGICWISLDRTKLAQSAFMNLLSIEPFFDPGALTSPKVLDVFTVVQENFRRLGALDAAYQPSLTPVANFPIGQQTPFVFEVKNAKRASDVTRVSLLFRKVGASNFVAIDMTRESAQRFSAAIPPEFFANQFENMTVSYYIEALSANGQRVTGVGSADYPLIFTALVQQASLDLSVRDVSHSTKSFWDRSWPYWLSGGILVAAGVVLGVVLSGQPQMGSMRIVVHGPQE